MVFYQSNTVEANVLINGSDELRVMSDEEGSIPATIAEFNGFGKNEMGRN